MDSDFKNFVNDLFEIDIKHEYEFRRLYNLTFAFEREIFKMKGKITSASIRPVAIIYEENDEFYLAPLDEAIEKDAIIKEFVEKILK